MNGNRGLSLIVRGFLVVTTALELVACSKTVQWEEEVPLNTGETIWLKRTVKYTVQGGAGNPFDWAYRPEDNEVTEFIWNNKKFRYKGDAQLYLLAISPQNYPVLVAGAGDNAWNWVHHYACTVPYYVQLVPDGTGQHWTWPSKIETWLYELPMNLLRARHSPEKMKKRYTAAAVQLENRPGAENWPHKQKIDPAYTGDLCKGK